ncbi:unnamed protein product [Leuciscus chuanchicus]
MADGESDGPLLPFSDPLYLKAALLDPSFGTMWLTHVLVPENTKEAVSAMIKYLILKEAYKTTPVLSTTHVQEDQVAGPEHPSGLFTAYRKKQKRDSISSPLIQLNHYLDICDGQNSLEFWAMNRHTLPSLFKVVDLGGAGNSQDAQMNPAAASTNMQQHPVSCSSISIQQSLIQAAGQEGKG